MTRFSTSILALSLVFFSGCGGSSTNSESGNPGISKPLVELLAGRTYYNTDDRLLEQGSYIEEVFNDETMIETQYGVGDSIEFSETYPYTINGDQLILTLPETGDVPCDVEGDLTHVTLTCYDPEETVSIGLWDSLEKAKANPDIIN